MSVLPPLCSCSSSQEPAELVHLCESSLENSCASRRLRRQSTVLLDLLHYPLNHRKEGPLQFYLCVESEEFLGSAIQKQYTISLGISF